MTDVTSTYYAGQAFLGYGTELLVGQDDGSPETFSAIADVMEITPGEMSTEVHRKTHLRSPEAHHEKLAGLRDSGPFVVKGNWRPGHGSQSNVGGDGHTVGLVGLWRQRVERNFQILLPIDAATGDLVPAEQQSPESERLSWPFRGVVTKFQPGGISNGAPVDFTCEITPLQDNSANLP